MADSILVRITGHHNLIASAVQQVHPVARMYCLSKAFFVISGSITLILCITSLQIDFIIHAAAAVNMVYPYQVSSFSLSAWARGGCFSLVRLLYSFDCLSTLNNTTQYVISMHFSLMVQPIIFFSKMHFTMMCAYSEGVWSSPWLYYFVVCIMTDSTFLPQALRGANVHGTQNILLFACTSKIKPLHYIRYKSILLECFLKSFLSDWTMLAIKALFFFLCNILVKVNT